MLEITSSANAIFKNFSSLNKSKGIKDEGLFILSGKDLIAEFLKNPTLEIEAELITGDLKPLVRDTKVKRYHLSTNLFKELDTLGTHSNLLVLKTPEIQDWKTSNPIRGMHLIVPLGDPTNLGALARSAEAFGASALILLREAANPFLPKAIKSSAGSLLRIPLLKGPSIHDVDNAKLKNLVALDLNGIKLSDHKWHKDSYLLVGEEGSGLPSMKTVQRLTIPTQGVESLNATVATSIALYSYRIATGKA